MNHIFIKHTDLEEQKILRSTIRPLWRRAWAKIEQRLAPVEVQLRTVAGHMVLVEGQVANIGGQIAPLEAKIAAVAGHFVPVEAQIAGVGGHFIPVEARISEVEKRVALLSAQIGEVSERHTTLERAWREHVPSFLNAMATVPALSRQVLLVRQSSDENKQEAVRRVEEVEATLGLMATSDRLKQAEEQLAERCKQTEERLAAVIVQSTDFVTSNEANHTANLVRASNTDTSIRSLWERIEFVRREILFEMTHGAGQTSKSVVDTGDLSPRVVNTNKMAAAYAEGSMRLNLGCGHIPLPDYLNVDMRELPSVDIVAEAGNLPFEPSTVDTIFSAHLLEHFPQETLRRRLLPYWHSLLRRDGILHAVTPDAAAMLAGAGAGTYTFEDFREVVFGSQDYEGDYHFNLFTPDSLRSLLVEAGFVDVEVPVMGRVNGRCYEFEIKARRP